MKIGEFAEKYSMRPSAVRYYIDRALITPDRENNQYIFGSVCISQMNKIIKLKDFGFTLDDIALIMSYENLSDLKDRAALNKIIHMFSERRDAISQDILRLDEIVLSIEEEIEKYSQLEQSLVSASKTAIPLKVLRMLQCPLCGSSITMENVDIEPEGVVRGKISCSCGYQAEIINGVLICNEYYEESPLKAFENVNFIDSLTEDFSASYRTLISRSHLSIYQTIASEFSKEQIVLSGPFSYTFTLNFMKNMPPDNLYIIIDPSIQKIERMKEYLSDCGREILFIVGNIDKLPLKDQLVDVYIDDFSFVNFTFVYSKNMLLYLNRILKQNASVIGHYIDYTNAPESLRSFRELQPNFNPSLMSSGAISSYLREGGLKVTEKIIVGSPEGNKKHFKCHVPGEVISLGAYRAKKTSGLQNLQQSITMNVAPVNQN